MDVFAVLCIIAGVVFYIIGSIGIMVEEFKVSILWGLCGLLFQIVHIAFAILHFQECKKWFKIMLLGLGLCILGVIIGNLAS